MARKVFGDSLKSAMSQKPESGETSSHERTSPTVERARASVMEEDKQATRLIDANSVKMSRIMDRIDPSDGIDDLKESIRENGQKVPILVRRLENGNLEVVYGRRRLLACQAIGQKVRATVMEMTDEEAIIAQGVENNARQDPSYIERALFATSIIRELDANKDTKAAQRMAAQALNIHETEVSRMKKMAEAIPEPLIRWIGPAHGAGRRQWEKLKGLCATKSDLKIDDLLSSLSRHVDSVKRLATVIQKLEHIPADKELPPAAPYSMKRSGNRLLLDVDPRLLSELESQLPNIIWGMCLESPDFHDWAMEQVGDDLDIDDVISESQPTKGKTVDIDAVLAKLPPDQGDDLDRGQDFGPARDQNRNSVDIYATLQRLPPDEGDET